MMIALNSLVRQKEGAQGEEEKAVKPTLPQVKLGQGCQMRGTVENMDGGVGFHSTGRARDQSYHLTIGMEGATEKRTKL